MNKKQIKRRYFDFRIGHVSLNPILQFGNFLMLAYLTISEFIPMWLFAPLFVITVLATFTLVGHKVRAVQHSTDFDMSYEKSPSAANTRYETMLSNKQIMEKLEIPVSKSFLDRLEIEKNIAKI